MRRSNIQRATWSASIGSCLIHWSLMWLTRGRSNLLLTRPASSSFVPSEMVLLRRGFGRLHPLLQGTTMSLEGLRSSNEEFPNSSALCRGQGGGRRLWAMKGRREVRQELQRCEIASKPTSHALGTSPRHVSRSDVFGRLLDV